MFKRNLARHFQHHVSATIKLSPPPSSAAEVQHLFANFKTLGNLEYFRIDRDPITTFGNEIRVKYAPSCRQMMLGKMLFDKHSHEINLSNSHDGANELEGSRILVAALENLVALPRYSYVDGDGDYFDSKVEVPFLHQLVASDRKWDDTYQLNTSSGSRQFVSLEGVAPEHVNELRAAMRHNFQKFHKFDSVVVEIGLDKPDQKEPFGFYNKAASLPLSAVC
ncbi:hypothetical protein DICA3_A08570 [Diutina catenulata]